MRLHSCGGVVPSRSASIGSFDVVGKDPTKSVNNPKTLYYRLLLLLTKHSITNSNALPTTKITDLHNTEYNKRETVGTISKCLTRLETWGFVVKRDYELDKTVKLWGLVEGIAAVDLNKRFKVCKCNDKH